MRLGREALHLMCFVRIAPQGRFSPADELSVNSGLVGHLDP